MTPVDDLSWQDHANCVGLDSNLFFPERGESCDEAKAICAACTVRAECLEYALANNEQFGIWGGTSNRERRAIRSRRRRGVAS